MASLRGCFERHEESIELGGLWAHQRASITRQLPLEHGEHALPRPQDGTRGVDDPDFPGRGLLCHGLGRPRLSLIAYRVLSTGRVGVPGGRVQTRPWLPAERQSLKLVSGVSSLSGPRTTLTWRIGRSTGRWWCDETARQRALNECQDANVPRQLDRRLRGPSRLARPVAPSAQPAPTQRRGRLAVASQSRQRARDVASDERLTSRLANAATAPTAQWAAVVADAWQIARIVRVCTSR